MFCYKMSILLFSYPCKRFILFSETLHYNIEEYVLTYAGYKYSDVINDLNWDVIVTSLSFVRLAPTGKLKSSIYSLVLLSNI